MEKVIIRFPKVGLGNMLLVWARAYVFAYRNNIELIVPGWFQPHWGAWVRLEKNKRIYSGYFICTPWFQQVKWNLLSALGFAVHEPQHDIIVPRESRKYTFYFFSKPYSHPELFESLLPYRQIIIEGLYRMLKDKINSELSSLKTPCISAHIRRGDFKKKNPITSENYFIEVIDAIRQSKQPLLPVTIFTDADVTEINNVLSLPSTFLCKTTADITDILLMSKSDFIITSQSSTFSYWAAFLSEAIIIIPSADWQKNIRYGKDEQKEIRWNMNDPNCREQLRRAINLKEHEKNNQ